MHVPVEVGPSSIGLLVAAGLMAVVTVGLYRFGDRIGDRMLDRSSRDRIRRRISELDASRPLAAIRSQEPMKRVSDLGPRERLWRDTSAVLFLIGAGLLVALAVAQSVGPTGAVLEATYQPDTTLAALGQDSVRPTTAEPTRTPTLAASPTIFAASSATFRATEGPASPGPLGTSDRMALLRPCPNRPGCYVYVVRRGDNLVSIAHWFGIPYAEVLARNPQITGPSRVLHAGDRIELPHPLR